MQDWLMLKKLHCDRDKHRMRTNQYGVTWCVICGKLSSKDSEELTEKFSVK